MGSSGSHSFTDYPGSAGGSKKGTSASSGGGLNAGAAGAGQPSGCDVELNDLDLEEVGTQEFFRRHLRPPADGTAVRIRSTLVGGRMGVETTSGSEVVGLLPTKFNYLRRCIAASFRYEGEVSRSQSGALPQVEVHLKAVAS